MPRPRVKRRAGARVVIQEFPSVLIVKPSSLGDIIHTLPALSAMKKAHPEGSFRWIVREEFAPLLAGHPHLDEVIPFPRSRFRGFTGYWQASRWGKTLAEMPRELPEIAMDFQGLFRSAWLARKRQANFVAGMSDSREGARWFQDKIIPVPKQVHAVERYWEFAKSMSDDFPGQKEFHLGPGSWDGRPLPDQPFITLHPWSRGRKKSLSPALIRTLIEELAPYPVVLAGVPPDGTAPDISDRVMDYSSRTTLPQLIHLLRASAFVISVDSGPMHIAAALHGRVLGIHTWSDPRLVGPWNPDAHVWKVGLIRPWQEFSDEEAAQHVKPEAEDMRRIAQFVAHRLEEQR